jgi:AcrR family transcriptional regulator
VPLGNAYYYFKTKQALCEAVIAAHAAGLEEQFARWARHDDPRLRLRGMVRAPRAVLDDLIAYGCPHGSLCQELEKLGPDSPLAQAAAALMQRYVDWTTLDRDPARRDATAQPSNRRTLMEQSKDIFGKVLGVIFVLSSLPKLLGVQAAVDNFHA